MGEWAKRLKDDEDDEAAAVVAAKGEAEIEGLLARDMSLSILEHSLEQYAAPRSMTCFSQKRHQSESIVDVV